MNTLIKRFYALATMFFVAILVPGAPRQDKKLTLEELIAHHLESIGPLQARAAIKNRVVNGPVKLVSRVGMASAIDGEGAMAASGVKQRWSIKFSSTEYTGEQLAFDGNKVQTGFLPGGRRSPLSLYLDQQNLPLREGLLGGTLATGWAMLRLDQLKPKLEYRGVKKLDGRQLHEVGYKAQKGSSDLKISLFFDNETLD